MIQTCETCKNTPAVVRATVAMDSKRASTVQTYVWCDGCADVSRHLAKYPPTGIKVTMTEDRI